MSQSDPPPNHHLPAAFDGPLSKAPGGLGSKVTGIASGTGLIVFAERLGLPAVYTTALQASAPTLAVFISWAGPYVTRYLIHKGSWIGVHRALKRAKATRDNCNEGSPARHLADKNVEELELTISELMRAETKFFSKKK